jgi:hypothetical protein
MDKVTAALLDASNQRDRQMWKAEMASRWQCEGGSNLPYEVQLSVALKVLAATEGHRWTGTSELDTQRESTPLEVSHEHLPSTAGAIVLWRPLPDGSDRSSSQSSGS